MKFAIALLLAVVSAQTDELAVGACTTAADCEKNFDALYEQWDASDEEADYGKATKEESEPKKGELSCGNIKVNGTNAETEEAFATELAQCVPTAACAGWTDTINDVTIEVTGCGDGASKLVAGFAAAAIVAFAM